jgi:hypothetical protein
VDAAGTVDAGERAHRALEIAPRFPQASTATIFWELKTNNVSRLRARRNQTILNIPTAWPLFKRSSVAAFERSVTRPFDRAASGVRFSDSFRRPHS